jgi:hypothetical protein
MRDGNNSQIRINDCYGTTIMDQAAVTAAVRAQQRKDRVH